jgi:hypothetical protein
MMATTMRVLAKGAITLSVLLTVAYLVLGPLSGIIEEIPDWAAFAFVTVVALWITVLNVRAALYHERLRYKEALEDAARDPSDRLRGRIEEVGDAFASAVMLMDELQRELTSQEAAHRQLVEQANHQRTLVGMDREEAEAVQALILGATKEDHARQKRQQWLFFALGVLMSVPIGIAINLLVP